jgi:hypothetical protein
MLRWQVLVDFGVDETVRDAVEGRALGFGVPQWRRTPTGDRVVISQIVDAEDSKRLFEASWRIVEKLRHQLRTTAAPLAITIYPEGQTPPTPDIVGLTEVGELLGVTRQRALQLSKTRDFPRPVARLAAGVVYLRRDIDNFGARRDARRGVFASRGRPAAHTHLTPNFRSGSSDL